jgi:hypothetical protein
METSLLIENQTRKPKNISWKVQSYSEVWLTILSEFLLQFKQYSIHELLGANNFRYTKNSVTKLSGGCVEGFSFTRPPFGVYVCVFLNRLLRLALLIRQSYAIKHIAMFAILQTRYPLNIESESCNSEIDFLLCRVTQLRRLTSVRYVVLKCI